MRPVLMPLAVTRSKADGNVSDNDNDKRDVLREIGEAVMALQAVAVALVAEHAADNKGRREQQ